MHIGGGIGVPDDTIIGIFNIDDVRVAEGTRRLLSAAEAGGRVRTDATDGSAAIPRSFVLTRDGTLWLSPISAKSLSNRVY
jgi:hypothetical protein